MCVAQGPGCIAQMAEQPCEPVMRGWARVILREGRTEHVDRFHVLANSRPHVCEPGTRCTVTWHKRERVFVRGSRNLPLAGVLVRDAEPAQRGRDGTHVGLCKPQPRGCVQLHSHLRCCIWLHLQREQPIVQWRRVRVRIGARGVGKARARALGRLVLKLEAELQPGRRRASWRCIAYRRHKKLSR